MGENEEATLRTLSSHRKLIDSLIERHHGRFVNSAGDSVLAEFPSVVNGVQCAVEIQSTLNAENASLPPEHRMEFRRLVRYRRASRLRARCRVTRIFSKQEARDLWLDHRLERDGIFALFG